MIELRPKVFDSGFVAINENGYNLLLGAPQSVINEFYQYMNDKEENYKRLVFYAKSLNKKDAS